MAVKTKFNDHLRMEVKCGRKAPDPDKPKRFFREFLKGPLPTPPASYSFTPAAKLVASQMYLNDRLGDCVIAQMCKQIGLWISNAGYAPWIATDDQVIRLYSAVGGYNPSDPSTDQGCSMQTEYQDMQAGLPDLQGHKILGHLSVDPTNVELVKTLGWIFEGIGVGGCIADAYLNSAPGFTWSYLPGDPEAGHDVQMAGATPHGIEVWTWGMTGTWLDDAYPRMLAPQLGGEMHVAISQESINRASQKAGNAIDWFSLCNYFNAQAGKIVVVPPSPDPVPVPTPAPPPLPPTPVPVTQYVDQLFQQLERELAQYPRAVLALQMLNAWLDVMITSQKRYWKPDFQFKKEHLGRFMDHAVKCCVQEMAARSLDMHAFCREVVRINNEHVARVGGIQ